MPCTDQITLPNVIGQSGCFYPIEILVGRSLPSVHGELDAEAGESGTEKLVSYPQQFLLNLTL